MDLDEGWGGLGQLLPLLGNEHLQHAGLFLGTGETAAAETV